MLEIVKAKQARISALLATREALNLNLNSALDSKLLLKLTKQINTEKALLTLMLEEIF